MQKYMQKTKLSQRLDHLGLIVLYLLLSMGLFSVLWGPSVPSMTAGFSFFVLLILISKNGRQKRKIKKEILLKRKIGGEIYLEKLMLLPPLKAAEELFLLFSKTNSLEKVQSVPEGVIFKKDREKYFLAFLPLHKSETVFPSHLYFFKKAILPFPDLKKIFLCTPAAFSESAKEVAAEFPYMIHLDEKILLHQLGLFHPASGEKIKEYRKRKSFPAFKWYRKVLAPDHVPKYLIYSFFLMIMFFLTGFYAYIFSSLCLFLLGLISRILSFRKDKKRRLF